MRIRAVGEQVVCTSIVVAAELRFGALMRGSVSLAGQVETVLDLLETLPFDAPCDHRYAAIRCNLDEQGTPIEGNDLLIAAQAMEFGLTLVTHNSCEFSRVEGLHIEDWLE